MTACIFCRILAGELPASFVYRDERAAAFMDIQPVNPGHLLIVPTRHAAYLADIDQEIAALGNAFGNLLRRQVLDLVFSISHCSALPVANATPNPTRRNLAFGAVKIKRPHRCALSQIVT